MAELKIKYNELTAEQFIELWETVWGDGPTLEQTELAMKHTLFRVSIWDDDKIVAMARMNGDMGLNYYMIDCQVKCNTITIPPSFLPIYSRILHYRGIFLQHCSCSGQCHIFG